MSFSVAQVAADTIQERGRLYGPPLVNHQRIAGLWSVVFGHPVTPQQVAQCMRLVKESRLIETPGHVDSLIDLCGYAECEAQICGVTNATATNNGSGPTLEAGPISAMPDAGDSSVASTRSISSR